MTKAQRLKILLGAAGASLAVGLAASAQNLDVKGTTTTEGNAFFYQNVGIGNGGTAPPDKLTVNGSIQLATGNYDRFGAAGENTDEYHLVRVNAANNTSSLRLYLHDDPDEHFAIWGNSCAAGSCGNDAYAQEAHRLRVDGNAWLSLNGGAVGVGTSAPAWKLDVAGDVHATNWLRTDGNAGWYSQSWGGGWFMQDSTWLRTYNSKSVWTDSGLLGSNGGLTVGYGGASPPSSSAIIAGSVGIGTSSPATRLDVAGTIRSSSGGYQFPNGSVQSGAVASLWNNYISVHDCPGGGAGYKLIVQWCRSFNRCNDYGDWVSCSANGDSMGWAQAYANSGCSVVGNNQTGQLPLASGICVPQ